GSSSALSRRRVARLIACGAIAATALVTHHIPGMATFSPMILATVIGIAFHNIVGTPSFAKPGIAFGLRRPLRFAIMLLGFQLTLTVIAEAEQGDCSLSQSP